MEKIQRQTIIFFLPLGMEAFTSDQSPYSSTGANWGKRQLYINPQTINIRDNKFIKSDLTKGGFVTQYWGEQLTTIELGGTTGSSGIEGINVLRDIYRHEQLQYREILAERQRALAEAAAEAAKEAARGLSERTGVGGFFANVADTLTGGAFSDTVQGVSNTIDLIAEPFGGTSLGESFKRSGSFKTVPTLAAFATNVDMYYQGEFFRGYFTTFSVTENGTEPGHFTYSMGFTVTRRTGRRSNFMPWHREALSPDGETVMSQKTTVSKGTYPGDQSLTFPTDSVQSGIVHGNWANAILDPNNAVGTPGYVSSQFESSDATVEPELNQMELDRFGTLTGG